METISMTKEELEEIKNAECLGGQRMVINFVNNVLKGVKPLPVPAVTQTECLEIKKKIEQLTVKKED